MKIKAKLLSICATLMFFSTFAQNTEYSLGIFFKGDKIGTVKATEIVAGTKSTKDLRTTSDAKVMCVQIHVEMDVNTIQDNGVLVQGTAFKHANRGSEDVHSKTQQTAPKTYSVQRNNENSTLTNKVIKTCVIDLYFKEPVGITTVYSNMFAQDVPLAHIGVGKYKLTTPNNKSTTFTYQNGKLMTVESETALGTVTTKRQ
jgi:hypothetical protein